MSTYYEDCFGLTTKYLRSTGFFHVGKITYNDLKFISNGEVYNVRILTSLVHEPILICQYLYQGILRRVEIGLIARYNHLGGVGYKFQCPKSGKGCYKLYFVDGVLGSRNHFKLLNKSQVKSQRTKEMDKAYAIIFKAEKAEDEICSYRFRRYYNGKMTKKYKRCLLIIDKAKGLNLKGILN